MKNDEIKKLVRSEIAECFAKLEKDVADIKLTNITQSATMSRIERCLLGDKELSDIGLAEKVQYSYEYARRNTESGIVRRGEVAINKFSFWEDNKEIVSEIIEKYRVVKGLSILMFSSGLVSVINIIGTIIDMIKKIQ